MSVEKFLRKPCWNVGSKLLVSIWFLILDSNILSSSLSMYDLRVIGLYALTEVASFPGFGKNVTVHVFHGHLPVFITKLKIMMQEEHTEKMF